MRKFSEDEKSLLRGHAERLLAVLNERAMESAEATQLISLLKGVINDALDRKIIEPIRWSDLPGYLVRVEGDLSNYPDLENALAKFELQITGRAASVDELMGGIKR